MATLEDLSQITNTFIEEYTSKQGQLPDWFEMITKTLSSRNITLEDWNRLQQYLKNVVAENEALFNFCKTVNDILTNLNTKVSDLTDSVVELANEIYPYPDNIYYLNEDDLIIDEDGVVSLDVRFNENDYGTIRVTTTESLRRYMEQVAHASILRIYLRAGQQVVFTSMYGEMTYYLQINFGDNPITDPFNKDTSNAYVKNHSKMFSYVAFLSNELMEFDPIEDYGSFLISHKKDDRLDTYYCEIEDLYLGEM